MRWGSSYGVSSSGFGGWINHSHKSYHQSTVGILDGLSLDSQLFDRMPNNNQLYQYNTRSTFLVELIHASDACEDIQKYGIKDYPDWTLRTTYTYTWTVLAWHKMSLWIHGVAKASILRNAFRFTAWKKKVCTRYRLPIESKLVFLNGGPKTILNDGLGVCR